MYNFDPVRMIKVMLGVRMLRRGMAGAHPIPAILADSRVAGHGQNISNCPYPIGTG